MIPIYKVYNPFQKPLIGYYYAYQTLTIQKIFVDVSDHKAFESLARVHKIDYCNSNQDVLLRLATDNILNSRDSNQVIWYDSQEISSTSNTAILHKRYRHTHHIFVDYKTRKHIQLLGEPILTHCTYVKDVHGTFIFDRDIVHIGTEGLLATVYGIVFLDKDSLKYRVLLINIGIAKDWDKVVDLTEYKWEVTGQFNENIIPEPLLYEDFHLNFTSYKDWIYEHTLSGREVYIRGADRDVLPNVRYLSKIVDGQGTISLGYAYVDKSGKPAILDMQCLVDPQKCEPFDNVRRIALSAFLRGIRPKIHEGLSEDNIHPQVCSANLSTTREDVPLFTGDKFSSLEHPEIIASICYVPKQVQYCMEIPEDIVPRDELFDGYMSLQKDNKCLWGYEDPPNATLFHDLANKLKS